MNKAEIFLEKYLETQGWNLDVQISEDKTLPKESYFIDSTSSPSVIFSDLSGLRNGINAFKREIFLEQKLHTPSFSKRGVIEGFYGKPWRHEERLKGLNFFAAHNMNYFILAPKDDPWQRFDWHTPFDQSFLESTSELMDRARSVAIQLAVCISPGLTVRYSKQADSEALMVRYRQLASIGVTQFGLLLDDIPWDLQFDEDKKQYSSIAQAHGDFANRIYEAISIEIPGSQLFTCPLQYHGRGHESYIKEFGNTLRDEIDLMWTGRQICSEYLESVDARYFREQTSKKPFYWDNYPVNDVAMIHQLHVGPIEKRDSDLGQYAAGLVANPMEKFELSLISLATIGDYLWDSKNYDAEISWSRALNELVENEKERAAWSSFLLNCFESCLAVNPAPQFGDLLGETTLLWRTGRKAEAIEKLRHYSSQMTATTLIINNSRQKQWLTESERWRAKFEKVAAALLVIADVLERAGANARGGLTGNGSDKVRILELRNSLATDQTRIFGDGLDLTLGELATELTAARN